MIAMWEDRKFFGPEFVSVRGFPVFVKKPHFQIFRISNLPGERAGIGDGTHHNNIRGRHSAPLGHLNSELRRAQHFNPVAVWRKSSYVVHHFHEQYTRSNKKQKGEDQRHIVNREEDPTILGCSAIRTNLRRGFDGFGAKRANFGWFVPGHNFQADFFHGCNGGDSNVGGGSGAFGIRNQSPR